MGTHRDLPSLLSDKRFAEEIGAVWDGWHAVVMAAVRQGVRRRASPRVSATSSAPHTYTRTDREGSFHTLWGGDRSEVSTE